MYAHKNRHDDRCRIVIARLEIRQILRTDRTAFEDRADIVVTKARLPATSHHPPPSTFTNYECKGLHPRP